jgi:hypothetical protein
MLMAGRKGAPVTNTVPDSSRSIFLCSYGTGRNSRFYIRENKCRTMPGRKGDSGGVVVRGVRFEVRDACDVNAIETLAMITMKN